MRIFAVLAVMLFLGGCIKIAETSLIPSGIYMSSEPGSEEKIEVKGNEIFIHIKHMNGVFIDRQFTHSVYDGRISFVMSSNDWSILRYDWTFDGKVIWIENIETKKKVSFVRRN